MNLRAKLTTLPIGKWSEFQTRIGIVGIYHCDTIAADEDWYKVENPNKVTRRLTLNNTIKYLIPIMDD